MAMALGAARPADTRNVGDGITPGEKFTILKLLVHDSVDAIHLVHEPVDGVWELVDRVVAKMTGLARLRPEIGHLPEQPLFHRDPGAFVFRVEFPGLAAEILQDRARLEDRDRPAAGTR